MKIYLDTVGCRLNQAEIEIYARQFRTAGHEMVATPEEADLAVVNTCAVTAAAASDSRQKVRQMNRHGVDQLIVTGCWATLQPQEAAHLPGVTSVVGNLEKDLLVPQVLGLPTEAFDLEPVEREPLPGARLRTRAFIKAQDGCDNRCTFCITTVARGPGRSRSAGAVLEDVRLALAGGAQEIVLTGVHLGSWGHDLQSALRLDALVRAILEQTATPRLRLSSLEPWDLDEAFFSLWADPRLCRHLHLPLQSGSAPTLRRMARKTTPEAFAALVASARRHIPGVAITTDVIAGFPGETDVEFQETIAFIQQVQFAGGHVFTYSARQGTAAARMPHQTPAPVRKERNALLRSIFSEAAQAYGQTFLGKTLTVLWESATALGPQGWDLSGLTDNYLRVSAQAPERLWNTITPVQLTALRGEAFSGRVVGTVA